MKKTRSDKQQDINPEPIENAMKEKKLKLSDICNLTKLSRSTVHNAINGKKANINTIHKIADCLEISSSIDSILINRNHESYEDDIFNLKLKFTKSDNPKEIFEGIWNSNVVSMIYNYEDVIDLEKINDSSKDCKISKEKALLYIADICDIVTNKRRYLLDGNEKDRLQSFINITKAIDVLKRNDLYIYYNKEEFRGMLPIWCDKRNIRTNDFEWTFENYNDHYERISLFRLLISKERKNFLRIDNDLIADDYDPISIRDLYPEGM